MTSHLPDNTSYESASVLPLGVSTTAYGLFQKDYLNLQHPTVNPKATGKTLLTWGGSSSVGSNTMQLAVTAGYEIIFTCSPRNFEYCKALGAPQFFVYSSPTVNADIIKAIGGKTTAGASMVGKGSADAALDILSHCRGNKFIAMVSFPELPNSSKSFPVPRTILTFMSFMFVNGSDLVHNEVGKAIYADFLGQALEKGWYQYKPDPMVSGNGLEKLQEALDIQKRGVSAKKVVLTL